jgi:hypothetical protein
MATSKTRRAARDAARFVRTLQESVQNDEISVLDAAREAVWNGYLMVGGQESRPQHEPAGITKRLYRDLEAGDQQAQRYLSNYRERYKNVRSLGLDLLPQRPRLLRATAVAELAIAEALWGNFNDGEEQMRCALSIMGEYSNDIGYRSWPVKAQDPPWRTTRVAATYLIDRQGRRAATPQSPDAIVKLLAGDDASYRPHPREESAYKIYARPEFINVAADPQNPLTGCIDFIRDDVDTLKDTFNPHMDDDTSAWFPMPFQPGSWLTDRPQTTVFTLPVLGKKDMPPAFFHSKHEIAPEAMPEPN